MRGITNKWNQKLNKMEHYLSMDLRTITLVEAEKPEVIEPVKPDSASKIVLDKDLVWDIHRTYEGYKGERISFTEFMKAVNAGCVWCGEKIAPSEADAVTFTQPGRFACSICTKDGHALKYYGKKEK
jgi:hypothetical protein